MKKFGITLALAGLCVLPMGALAVNEGATVTAAFVAVPPTVDGVVAAGEWDAAGVAPGDWSDHGSSNPASSPTTVKALYSVDGLYLLYECPDAEVLSSVQGTEKWHGQEGTVDGAFNSTFQWAGDTDYVSLYLDPANYADDAPSADIFSYSIQWEPSFVANSERDDEGNSYWFSELGRWGGFPAVQNPPLTATDGASIYWTGGVGWQPAGVQIVDGPMDGGYVCEVKIPWSGLSGYTRHRLGNITDLGGGLAEADLNGDATDPTLSDFATVQVLGVDGDNVVPINSAVAGGMPAAGTTWKAQFCRFDGTTGEYTNWVGDTGGFVSRPFGNIVFGDAPATAVRDALMHN